MLYNYWLKDPSNMPLLAGVLSELQGSQNFELMAEVLHSLKSEVLELAWVKLYRAQLCIVNRCYTDAISVLESIDQQSDEHDQSRLLLAQICFLQRDYDKALAHLQPIAQLNAASAALNLRCLYFKGQFAEAQAFFRLLNKNNLSPECLGLAALITADAGEAEYGLELAQQTLAADPQQPDALVAAAYSLIDLQEFGQAKPYVTAGLQSFPTLGRLWSMQGQLELIDGNHQQASAAFEQAVRWMPDHVGTWLLKGWNQGLQQNWQAAIADFETAVDLDRNFAESHAAVAVAAIKLQKFEQAEHVLARAKRLDKQAFTVVYATALLAEVQGHAEEAQQLISAILHKPHYRGNQTYADVIMRQIKRGHPGDH